MTELLHMTDSYVRECDAQVLQVTAEGVILDKTCFYPRGGGVPCDQGWIFDGLNRHRVEEVIWQDNMVLHKVAGEMPKPNSAVRGLIDWDLRYSHMRHHTALHILSGAVYHMFGALITGGQVYRDRARLDFDLESLDQGKVSRIIDTANQIVKDRIPVQVKTISREAALKIPDLARTRTGAELIQKLERVRVVEIKDFDSQADGGPHVSNTGEVGTIRIVRTESKGKQNKRMEIALAQ